ncbi:hypothetical protein DYB37_006979 [Aphanomyces astaci]|uniref:Protein kinase domain-containing protein n=1 Tax=Aphanomyces astaci TaxID=112090 RepID=A0A418E2D0_APHAT|nr:hypothetical protein DYB37_006979 [Aphanomyces astaci]
MHNVYRDDCDVIDTESGCITAQFKYTPAINNTLTCVQLQVAAPGSPSPHSCWIVSPLVPTTLYPSTESGSMIVHRRRLDLWRINENDLRSHELLAKGTNGEVWVGDYRGLLVAVKKSADAGKSDQDVQKFIDEIKLFTKLDTDIYSFGVLVSELDTNDIPYADYRNEKNQPLNDFQIMTLVRQGTLQPHFTHGCPDWVYDLALRCLSLDPHLRPTSPRTVARFAATAQATVATSLLHVNF